MFNKLKNYVGSKFSRAKEFVACNKVVVAIVFLLVLGVAALIAATAAAPDSDRLNYVEKADGTLEVSEIKNTYKDGWFCRDLLTVPEQVDGKKVTSVARLDSAKLQKIILPNSVTEIKEEAFAGCSSLVEIILGNDLQIIGDGAWKNCSSLHNIVIPQSVRLFGKAVFEGTPIDYHTADGLNYVGSDENPYFALVGAGDVSLKEAHVHESAKVAARSCFEGGKIVKADTANLTELPSGMFAGCADLARADVAAATELGADCFENCVKLTNVVFGSELTTIGDRSLANTALTELVLPKSVTSIGEEAFYGCGGLAEIRVDEGNQTYHAKNNCLIETKSKTLIVGCKTSAIPNDGSVNSIGKEAFGGCSGLTSIVIPDSVTSIGSSAFSGCSGLKEAHFENPNGWKVTRSIYDDAKTVFGLDDPAQAAKYLTDTYCSYYWKREG